MNCLVECPTHQNTGHISEGNVRDHAWKKRIRKLLWIMHLTVSLVHPPSLWEMFSQEQPQSMFPAF